MMMLRYAAVAKMILARYCCYAHMLLLYVAAHYGAMRASHDCFAMMRRCRWLPPLRRRLRDTICHATAMLMMLIIHCLRVTL